MCQMNQILMVSETSSDGGICLQNDSANQDVVRKQSFWAGVSGGTCTCPNGQTYLAGDAYNDCKTLLCTNGSYSGCQKVRGPWSHKEVICSKLSPRSVDDKCSFPKVTQSTYNIKIHLLNKIARRKKNPTYKFQNTDHGKKDWDRFYWEENQILAFDSLNQISIKSGNWVKVYYKSSDHKAVSMDAMLLSGDSSDNEIAVTMSFYSDGGIEVHTNPDLAAEKGLRKIPLLKLCYGLLDSPPSHIEDHTHDATANAKCKVNILFHKEVFKDPVVTFLKEYNFFGRK